MKRAEIVIMPNGKRAVFCCMAEDGKAWVTPLDSLVSRAFPAHELKATGKKFRGHRVDPTRGRSYHKGRRAEGEQLNRNQLRRRLMM